MASGFKVAARVVESLAVLVEHLRFVTSTLSIVRSKKSRPLRIRLNDRSAALSTQRARLLNNIVIVIQGLDALKYDSAAVEELLDARRLPAIFDDVDASTVLEELLGHNRLAFIQCIARIQRTLKTVEFKLAMTGHSQHSLPSAHNSVAVLQRARQLKAHFPEALFDGLVADLKQANLTLDSIKPYLGDGAKTSQTGLKRDLLRQFKRFRALRHDADKLFWAMSSPGCWSCPCASEHNILFKLDADVADASSSSTFILKVPEPSLKSHSYDRKRFLEYEVRTRRLNDHNVSNHLPSGIKVTSSGNLASSSGQKSSLALRQHSSNVRDASRRSTVPPSSSPLTSASDAFNHSGGQFHSKSIKKVRISDPGFVSDRSNCDDQQHEFDIENLCSLFRSTEIDPSLQEQIGCLRDPTDPSYRYSFHRTRSGGSSTRVLTLRSKYCDVGYYNRREDLWHEGELPMQERLFVAATLACSAFQLQGTWMKHDWSCHDIVFLLSGDQKPLTTEMQVIASFGRPSGASGNDILARTLREPNMLPADGEFVLKPLGKALCEILLEAKVAAEGSHTVDDLQKAFSQLYNTWGRHDGSIANAVRECFIWSGQRSQSGFDDEEFSSAAFEKVVWPIMQSYQVFQGKTSSILNDGGRQYTGTTIGDDARAVLGDVHGDIHHHHYYSPGRGQDIYND